MRLFASSSTSSPQTAQSRGSQRRSPGSAGVATLEVATGTRLREIRVLPSVTTTSNRQWLNAAVEDAKELTLLVDLSATLGEVALTLTQTSATTNEDARAAYVSALAPVGRVRLRVTSKDYEPLIQVIDLKPGHKTGPGDMIFLTPK